MVSESIKSLQQENLNVFHPYTLFFILQNDWASSNLRLIIVFDILFFEPIINL